MVVESQTKHRDFQWNNFDPQIYMVAIVAETIDGTWEDARSIKLAVFAGFAVSAVVDAATGS